MLVLQMRFASMVHASETKESANQISFRVLETESPFYVNSQIGVFFVRSYARLSL